MKISNLSKGLPLSLCLKRTRGRAFAFTLAEVLITLGIIGVVCAMTIPALMQNANERANVVALKKAYSTLSNAYKLAEQENGTPDTWGLAGNPSPTMLSLLKPYLRIDKDCTDGSTGCFPPEGDYKYLAESLGNHGVYDDSVLPKLKLVDGTLILGAVDSTSCNLVYGTSPALQNECGWYMVDINGYKKPNQSGKDLFYFWLTKSGIVPACTARDNIWTFVNDCRDKNSAHGFGCAAWVIYNDNEDYLRCSDLDWNTKTKCN